MPRKKRSSSIGKQKILKRWCSENAAQDVLPISPLQSQSNLRLTELESLPGKEIEASSSCAKYIIVQLDKLSELMIDVKCKFCDSASVRVEVGPRKGFSHDLKVVCDTCSGIKTEISSSSPLNKEQKLSDVNFRIVQSFPRKSQICN